MLILIGVIAGVLVLQLDRRDAPPPAASAVASPSASPVLPVSPVELAATDTPERLHLPAAAGEPDLPADSVLFVPSAGIYAPIVQVYLDGISWDVTQLGRNAGHLQGTALPGEDGNVVLSGHVEMADGRAGPFATLEQIKIGDTIEITMNATTWRYVVTEIHTTTSDDLTPVMPAGEDRLTLVTCGAYDFFSNSYPDRLVVSAVRIG